MPPSKRNLLAGAVATGILATSILAYMLATGGVTGGSRIDTSLDASTRLSPPTDWRRGYVRAGAICYSQDATDTTSKCFASNVLAYTTDTTDTGWAIEFPQTNRFPYNSSSSCDGTPFVCVTATMDSTSADPTGGTTASSVTFGGGTIDATAFGHTNSTALDLRFWAKCTGGGTLDATHVGGTGSWSIDATAMGTGWRLMYPARAEVTENTAFESDGSGNLRLQLSGVDCTFWGFTVTEAPSPHHSTIPTTDATGATVAAAVWAVDNSTGAYWASSGVTKTATLTKYFGTCWDYTAATIYLSKAGGGCVATWYALTLKWSY